MYSQGRQPGYGQGGNDPNQYNQGPWNPQFGGQAGGYGQGGFSGPEGQLPPSLPTLGGPAGGPGFNGPPGANTFAPGSQGYGIPPQGYGPNAGYGAPQGGPQRGPQPGFGAPPGSYGSSPSGFGGAQAGFSAPPGGFGGAPAGFGAPPGGFGGPTPGPAGFNPSGPGPNFQTAPAGGLTPSRVPAGPTIPGNIELKFRCENLRNRDTFGKSDPFLQVELVSRGQKLNLGRTESINNNLNPTFQKTVPAPFNFEVPQELTLLVYDSDSMTDNDLIGRGVCMLADVVASRNGGGHIVTLGGTNGQAAGVIYITYDKLPVSRQAYIFNISCSEVRDIEVFSKSDPFVRISRASDRATPGTNPSQIPAQDWTVAYETEFKKNDLNPIFQEFVVNGSKLCRSNVYLPIKFEIFDYSRTGSPTLIGRAFTSVAKITAGERRFTTYDDKSQKGGDVIINQLQEITEYDLIDYLRNGLQIGLSFAIDFTGSNGDPKSSSSLHNLTQGSNAYQAAITQVGKCVLPFDNDKLIPAYGFGAKVNGTYSDCFPLSTGPCNGVQGLLDAYSKAVKSVELWGPTNFAPVIRNAQGAARSLKTSNPMAYLVLVILTDGQITDFQETQNELVKAASLPMSVLIIGVGKEDFSQMDALDGDKGKLTNSQGQSASRDIVQFVELKKVAQNDFAIAEAVLQELPGHINLYFFKQGFKPKI